MLGLPWGLGLFTKADSLGSAGTMPKPDFRWVAGLAHGSAALAWDALAQRGAAAAAAALVRLPGKAPPLALGPLARPPPKALQDLLGPPEPLAPAEGAAAEGSLEPGPGVGPEAEFSAKPRPEGAC